MLAEIGVVFCSPQAEAQKAWDKMVAALVAYKRTHGDCDVPPDYWDTAGLARWVVVQRQLYVDGRLTDVRVKQLSMVGFVWDRKDHYWRKMLSKFIRLFKQTGIDGLHPSLDRDAELSKWVRAQQLARARGQLSSDRQRELQANGFPWHSEEEVKTWTVKLSQLAAYKEKYGDCDVPPAWKLSKLGEWVARQRQHRAAGQLTPEQIAQLDTMGFVWDRQAHRWMKMHSRAAVLVGAVGAAGFEAALENDIELRNWVVAQLVSKRRGLLPLAKQAELESLGLRLEAFEASRTGAGGGQSRRAEKRMRPAERSWEDDFARLTEFHKLHGHRDMKLAAPADEALHKWTHKQRQARKQDELTADRIHQLDQLGFIWETGELLWERMLAILIVYKSKHGNCDVPRYWQEDPQLAIWVATQRNRQRLGELEPERVEKLQQVGFRWDESGS